MATNSKTKSTEKKAPAKKAPAKKAVAKKAPAAKPAATKKSPAKAPASKSAAKKAPVAKSDAKKAPVKKAAPTKKASKPASAASTKAAEKAAPAAAVAKSTATAKSTGTAKAPAKAPAKRTAAAGSKSVAPSKVEKPVEQLRFGSPGYPFDQAFLDAQIKLLHEERETLVGQATSLRSEADALARDREPGDVQFDDESGEGDTLAVERDMDLARAASAMHTVDEIDSALERINKGVYGICEYSGLAIPKERLKAIPYARERVEFKTRSFR